jgi:hypothetical protein
LANEAFLALILTRLPAKRDVEQENEPIMLQYLKHYIQQDRGAVTVEWVVLTAVVIVAGVAIAAGVSTSSVTLSVEIWNYMDSLELFD